MMLLDADDDLYTGETGKVSWQEMVRPQLLKLAHLHCFAPSSFSGFYFCRQRKRCMLTVISQVIPRFKLTSRGSNWVMQVQAIHDSDAAPPTTVADMEELVARKDDLKKQIKKWEKKFTKKMGRKVCFLMSKGSDFDLHPGLL